MSELNIKEITSFIDDNTKKTRLVVFDEDKETEIILEGSGSLKIAALEV